jgi:hypothetical protein
VLCASATTVDGRPNGIGASAVSELQVHGMLHTGPLIRHDRNARRNPLMVREKWPPAISDYRTVSAVEQRRQPG